LRTRLNGAIPAKMLIHCNKKKDASAAAEYFNKLSKDNNWRLVAAAIHGAVNVAECNATKAAFKAPLSIKETAAWSDAWKKGGAMPTGAGRIVDVGVQCSMLG
jgi:hypothetical protein